MKRVLLSATILLGVCAGIAPAMADDTPDLPLPKLNNRYVCVITDEHPPRDGFCVGVPLPVAPRQ